MKSLFAFSALSLLIAVPASAAIFGADNRVSVGPNSPFKEVQRATALGVLSGVRETAADGTIKLNTDPLEGAICSTEKFSREQSLQYSCTGFLIGPDLLLTAGHCGVNVGISEHESGSFCKVYSWLFDYAPNLDGVTQTSGIDPDRMYKCKEIIFAANEEQAPFRDFAIVRLDRPVLGRTPLKLSTAPVSLKDSLSMVGHPMGLSAKAATNARVLVNDPTKEKIITTLDAFGGNSGSPVLNAKKEVVGILVGGFPSANFLKPEGKSCQIYNRCDDNGLNCLAPDTDLKPFPYYQATGSEVQRLDGILEMLQRIE